MSRSLGPAFRRLFAASASSNLADGATRVALPLLAASLTREPVLVAALTSLAFVPWLLFALPAGAPGADPRGAVRPRAGRLPHAGLGRDPGRGPAGRPARRRHDRAHGFVVAGCAELLVTGVLCRLLAVHRDVVAGAFAVPAGAEEPAR